MTDEEIRDHVWICQDNPNYAKPFGFFPDFNGGEDRDAETEASYAIKNRNSLGESIPRNEMPSKFYHSSPRKSFKRSVPDFFITQYFFFKDSVVDIFRQFDMGGGYFHPISLYQWDRTTFIADDVYTLCFGNAKDTVIIDETPNMRDAYDDFFRLPFMPEDGEIITRRSALDGPDIWGDPKIKGSVFFLSGRLAGALISAGLKDKMGLVRTTSI